jgi:hypothetical protein
MLRVAPLPEWGVDTLIRGAGSCRRLAPQEINAGSPCAPGKQHDKGWMSLYWCLWRASLALMSGQNSGSRLPRAEAVRLVNVR